MVCAWPPSGGSGFPLQRDRQHRVAFAEPLVRVLAVAILVEVRPPDGVMHQARVRPRGVEAHQVVPPRRQLPDEAVVGQPLELVQLEPGRGIDVLGGERRAACAVHQHDGRPVLLAVFRLHLAQELHVLARHVLVLDDLDRIALVTQVPELPDVVEHQHVAVHERRPTLVAAQVGDEEAREREIRGLQRVALAPVIGAELREHHRRDRHGPGRAGVDRVRQHAECHRLARIVADEHADHRVAASRRYGFAGADFLGVRSMGTTRASTFLRYTVTVLDERIWRTRASWRSLNSRSFSAAMMLSFMASNVGGCTFLRSMKRTMWKPVAVSIGAEISPFRDISAIRFATASGKAFAGRYPSSPPFLVLSGSSECRAARARKSCWPDLASSWSLRASSAAISRVRPTRPIVRYWTCTCSSAADLAAWTWKSSRARASRLIAVVAFSIFCR